MKQLRLLHLYLGCLFAPMLLFFAASGIWQMYGFGNRYKVLALLSTIHTSHNLKIGGLASLLLRDFELVMAVSFIVSVVLGVVMAVKFGRNRLAVYGCLALGVILPLGAVVFRAHL